MVPSPSSQNDHRDISEHSRVSRKDGERGLRMNAEAKINSGLCDATDKTNAPSNSTIEIHHPELGAESSNLFCRS